MCLISDLQRNFFPFFKTKTPTLFIKGIFLFFLESIKISLHLKKNFIQYYQLSKCDNTVFVQKFYIKITHVEFCNKKKLPSPYSYSLLSKQTICSLVPKSYKRDFLFLNLFSQARHSCAIFTIKKNQLLALLKAKSFSKYADNSRKRPNTHTDIECVDSK